MDKQGNVFYYTCILITSLYRKHMYLYLFDFSHFPLPRRQLSQLVPLSPTAVCKGLRLHSFKHKKKWAKSTTILLFIYHDLMLSRPNLTMAVYKTDSSKRVHRIWKRDRYKRFLDYFYIHQPVTDTDTHGVSVNIQRLHKYHLNFFIYSTLQFWWICAHWNIRYLLLAARSLIQSQNHRMVWQVCSEVLFSSPQL